MSDPGDISATAGIELSFRREDGQDAVGEAEQLRGAAIPEPPGPFLGSDVIGDRQVGLLPPQLATQPHIGADVIDQHQAIQALVLKQTIHPGLQAQGRQDQRQGFPQADRSHRSRIRQQFRPRSFHPRPAEGQNLQRQAPPLGFLMQGTDQQAALQITGDLAGADQQPHHQRLLDAGIGPRRPCPMEASRKRQKWAAAGRRSCCLACSSA